MIYFIIILGVILIGWQIQNMKHYRIAIVLENEKFCVNSSIVLWLFLAVILIVFGGIRYGVGADFFSYQEIFTNIVNNREQNLRHPFSNPWTEAGYVILSVIVSYISTDPQSIIFATSIITAVGLLYAASKATEYLPMTLFIALTTFLTSYTLIRQGIACTFLMIAIHFLYVEDKKRAYLFLITAALFHYTAIIMAIAILVSQHKFKKSTYLFGIGASVIASVFSKQISYFVTKMTYAAFLEGNYYLQNMRGKASTVDTVVALIMVCLCIRWYKSFIKDNKRNILYVNLLYLFFLTTTILWWFPFMFRLRMYFYTPLMFIMPKLFYINSKKRRKDDLRLLVFIMMVGVYLLNFTPLLGYSGYNTILGVH